MYPLYSKTLSIPYDRVELSISRSKLSCWIIPTITNVSGCTFIQWWLCLQPCIILYRQSIPKHNHVFVVASLIHLIIKIRKVGFFVFTIVFLFFYLLCNYCKGYLAEMIAKFKIHLVKISVPFLSFKWHRFLREGWN